MTDKKEAENRTVPKRWSREYSDSQGAYIATENIPHELLEWMQSVEGRLQKIENADALLAKREK